MASRFRSFALAAAALPLALALSACGDKKADGAPSGEPAAKVAPPSGKAWSDVVAKTEEGGYRVGNPDAPIKLVEYGALSCSHCAEFAKESSEKLLNDYVASGRVSYELRFFMLNAFDVPATLLATCGANEAVIPLAEQFWAWQPNMFTNLQAAGDPKIQQAAALPPAQRMQAIAQLAGMSEFFASRGISRDQGAACLADTAKADALAKQTETASNKYEVSGTPTFFINDTPVGTSNWATLEPKLQAAGAR
ncbi:protein-disulfide isomerase [Novosphingobium chloroacetimidivorans]|uniref:Protein-disulfide isomerase n=1 Tax=Novosphingobium chloroacetimidivorans TaxID=1428314 RepID=A0A7W7K8X0_9SPHN|nr:thioredoxin domain-containing protein [Novosphingobium chloroacetimidivorans]MBB4857713.1 protein-disulfide isomerase [Novosphingobium chloroacetimidivorans]